MMKKKKVDNLKAKLEESTKWTELGTKGNKFRRQPYLNAPRPRHRQSITHVRFSNHALAIEVGRWETPKIKRNDRTCKMCNEDVIEDFYHAAGRCLGSPNVCQLRVELLNGIYNLEADEKLPRQSRMRTLIEQGDRDTLMQLLLNSNDTRALELFGPIVTKVLNEFYSSPPRYRDRQNGPVENT